MANLRVLICGGGVAGPALAYWLARSGHRVVVVERYPVLRASGAQIDLRGHATEVIKLMGLYETIRSQCVDEPGASLVDSQGTVKATLLANKSGKGAQTFTSEWEIMRGDLVRILYDATKDNVEYMFGKTLERFDQDDKQVIAYFSDGSSGTYDILVGADGQRSRIGKAILPAGSPDPFWRLGLHVAYWFIPRAETDTNMMDIHVSTRGRLLMRRSHSPTETQVYCLLRDDTNEFSSIHKTPVDQQKVFWAQHFRGAGWQAHRFIEGLETTDNFFCHECVQVRIDKWHKGRVVLLGDAGYCPSPASGMGTSSSLVGAYVLAGEIKRHAENPTAAFANYHETLRPFISSAQNNIDPRLRRLGMPISKWGIAIFYFVVRLICWLRIPQLMARFQVTKEAAWNCPYIQSSQLPSRFPGAICELAGRCQAHEGHVLQ